MKEDRILFLLEKPLFCDGHMVTRICGHKELDYRMGGDARGREMAISASLCQALFGGTFHVFCQHPSAPHFDSNCILRNWI